MTTKIDPATLTVEHDVPLPQARPGPRSKWSPLFAQLRPGSRIPCKPEHADRIAQALRAAIASREHAGLKDCKVAVRTDDVGQCAVYVVGHPVETPGPASKLARGAPWPKKTK